MVVYYFIKPFIFQHWKYPLRHILITFCNCTCTQITYPHNRRYQIDRTYVIQHQNVLQPNMQRKCLIPHTTKCIEYISFLPPIPLLDLILEVKRRLFFYGGIHPLDGLPLLVEVQTSNPIFTDWPFVSHIKPYIAFDIRVDYPTWTFDTQYALIQVSLRPWQFDMVVTDAHYV